MHIQPFRRKQDWLYSEMNWLSLLLSLLLKKYGHHFSALIWDLQAQPPATPAAATEALQHRPASEQAARPCLWLTALGKGHTDRALVRCFSATHKRPASRGLGTHSVTGKGRGSSTKHQLTGHSEGGEEDKQAAALPPGPSPGPDLPTPWDAAPGPAASSDPRWTGHGPFRGLGTPRSPLPPFTPNGDPRQPPAALRCPGGGPCPGRDPQRSASRCSASRPGPPRFGPPPLPRA